MVTGMIRLTALRTVIFLTLHLLFACKGLSEGWYFSNTGDDRFSGKSRDTPWATLDRLNTQELKPGDSLFFRRGDIFRGQLILRYSGIPGNPIFIGTYGSGDAPVFSGTIPVQKWQKYNDRIFSAAVNSPVRSVYIDQVMAIKARYPNTGFLTIDKGIGRDGLADESLREEGGYWKGATVRIRTIDWVYEVRKVSSYKKGEIRFGKHAGYPVEQGYEYRFSPDQNQTMYDIQPGYGYYLEDKFEQLDAPGEWYFDQKENRLFIMADTASLIEAGVFDYGVKFENEIHDIVIQGIVLEKYTGAGTYSAYPVWNLDIRDNVYRNMDGSGIRLDGIPTHCTISSNRMDRINSRAISLMRAVDCTVTGNQISHTGLIRGYGLSGVNGASAISMPNLETQVQSEPFAHNNLIQFNTIDSCGYVGIRVDGHDNTIINNVISNCMLTLNDGAGIYCFARQTGVTFKNTIQNNIVINIIGDNTGTPGNSLIAKGIYLDNYSHENMVEGNTIINARSAGILVNDGSNRNKILNNNLFGNNAGISFAEWRSVGQNYGNEVKGNSVICAKASQKAIDLINHISSEMKPAIFENNFYCNFYDQYFFRILTNHKIYRNTSEMSFDVWKDRTRQDGTSKSLNPGDLVKYPGGAIILYNEGKIEKEYSIKEKKYYYIDGKRAGESITLEPFRSVILLVE